MSSFVTYLFEGIPLNDDDYHYFDSLQQVRDFILEDPYSTWYDDNKIHSLYVIKRYDETTGQWMELNIDSLFSEDDFHSDREWNKIFKK